MKLRSGSNYLSDQIGNPIKVAPGPSSAMTKQNMYSYSDLKVATPASHRDDQKTTLMLNPVEIVQSSSPPDTGYQLRKRFVPVRPYMDQSETQPNTDVRATP